MNPKKIFIVDDEIAILKLLKQAFETQGYSVHTAESAEDALETLKTETFEVMFLDLLLPGMDGLDLCRAIRKDKPDALIYAITGHAAMYELNGCLNAGFDGYFLKPLNLKLLSEIVEEAFNP